MAGKSKLGSECQLVGEKTAARLILEAREAFNAALAARDMAAIAGVLSEDVVLVPGDDAQLISGRPAQLAAMGAVAIDRRGRYWLPGRGVVMVARTPSQRPPPQQTPQQVSGCGQVVQPNPPQPQQNIGAKRPASETVTSEAGGSEEIGVKRTRLN